MMINSNSFKSPKLYLFGHYLKNYTSALLRYVFLCQINLNCINMCWYILHSPCPASFLQLHNFDFFAVECLHLLESDSGFNQVFIDDTIRSALFLHRLVDFEVVIEAQSQLIYCIGEGIFFYCFIQIVLVEQYKSIKTQEMVFCESVSV